MDLLRESAPTAVCGLLLVLLDKAAGCADRLSDASDSDALHDFRVALRRLNANQRAYRDLLADKPGKGLRRLARATNAARDREVQIEWLRLQRKECAAQARGDLDALIAKLEHAHELERDEVYPQWQAEFAEQSTKLRRRLAEQPPVDDSKACFAVAAAAQLQALGDKFRQDCAAITAHGDDDSVHAARITGKRLRYLLEPLSGAVPGVPPLIKRLKALQDLLGEIHDCQVRLDDFAGRSQPERAAQYADLQRDTTARRAQLLEELHKRWLGESAEALFKSLRRVIARLEVLAP